MEHLGQFYISTFPSRGSVFGQRLHAEIEDVKMPPREILVRAVLAMWLETASLVSVVRRSGACAVGDAVGGLK